jgi:hypothetical protein
MQSWLIERKLQVEHVQKERIINKSIMERIRESIIYFYFLLAQKKQDICVNVFKVLPPVRPGKSHRPRVLSKR